MNKKTIGDAIGLLAAAVGAGFYWTLCHCRHEYSRPFTWKRGKLKIYYATCLECGQEFRYDINTRQVCEQIHLKDIIND
jgi:transcription elongation factor Elf1